MFFIFLPDILFPNAPPKYKTVNARIREVIGIQCTQHLLAQKHKFTKKKKKVHSKLFKLWDADDLVVLRLNAEMLFLHARGAV